MSIGPWLRQEELMHLFSLFLAPWEATCQDCIAKRWWPVSPHKILREQEHTFAGLRHGACSVSLLLQHEPAQPG